MPDTVMQVGDVFTLGNDPGSWLVVMATRVLYALVRMRDGESRDDCHARFLFDEYDEDAEYRTLPRVAVDHATRIQ